LLEGLTGVVVSEATARRQTEAAGAACVALQEAEVERIERELPEAAPGPEKQLWSVDGVLIPLVHGEWAEVKTLVIGEVAEPVQEQGEWVVHTPELSYFSRWTDADTLGRLAWVETQRRGVENARQVCAVADGAEWEQGFFDFHRPDAVRILDFAHAAERIAAVGQAVWGEGTEATQQWVAGQWHRLKQEGPADVLAELRSLREAHPGLSVVAENLAYLEKREAHRQYPTFRAQGWPIGSGSVESGNQLVVEDRLKGSGMHWPREHVDPLLALRNVVCNDRWDEMWPPIAEQVRQQAAQQRQERRERHRHAQPQPSTPTSPPPPAPAPPPIKPAPPPTAAPSQPCPTPSTAGALQQRRPAPDHPWRRMPIGRARYGPSPPNPCVKN
jgi:hypothetical protein